MLITKEWLKKKLACKDGYEWSLKQKGFDKGIEVIKFLDMLVKSDRWDWANWVIIRVMTRPQYLAYAIFSAEQVLDLYESKYPNDDRPRKAIESAKAVLKNDTPKNMAAAWAADRAAWAAARAAWAAWEAAGRDRAAACAAWAAAWATRAAWEAAWAAAWATRAAWEAAWEAAGRDMAAGAARKEMQTKIMDYGIKLLEEA